ncbi:MAG: M24 family metallopeptidase [Clostridiaceae bacterium]|jgi:Xaa-Pro aminopeptidase|nr:M24 family metallopeptidase [Bacillota bacterium]NLN52379.1 M24 family metallopeptidase [Clostridiaceae bacterium]
MKVRKKKINSLPNQLKKLDERNLPKITAEDYQQRLADLINLGRKDYTHYLIYGDREHFANIEYFTGIDPRFEEALLVITKDEVPTLIVGDEGIDYSKRIPYEINDVVYHGFSLPRQPRPTKTVLRDILSEAGLNKESKVAVIGWKWFDNSDFATEEEQFDIPLFIYNELAYVCTEDNLSNGTYLLQDNEIGLRTNLCAKELILSEVSGTKCSNATHRVLKNLRPGITELEASKHLMIDGDPLSIHPNVNFNKNYYYAIASPMPDNELQLGDVVGAGMAYRRSLCHKVGLFVKDENELEPERRENAKQIFEKYFLSMKTWYETVQIGVTGKEVYDAVVEVMGEPIDFGVKLNLGHGIHTDEWLNTPFYKDSPEKLHSGMAIQCDFTAAFEDLDIGVHAEDGIIIADQKLQEEIKELSPDSYERMLARREFMKNELGIYLADEVLPTSDLSGMVFPFMGDLNVVMAYLEE